MPFLPHAPKGVGGGAANIFYEREKIIYRICCGFFAAAFRDAKLRSIRI